MSKKEENFVPKAFKKEIKHKKRRKKILLAILIIIIILCIETGVKFGVKAYKWSKIVGDMMIQENSEIVDMSGKSLAKIGSEKNKMFIAKEDIPDKIKNAYVSIEDERFYKHGGVDVKRTASAIASYMIHFGSSSYGGSTITQQLVKNLTGDTTDSIARKVREWEKAWQLELYYSKEDILSTYLNVIYVGPNIYGIETGAKYYFNKSVKDLSLAESAFLAGINHSPNSYNPFTDNDNGEKIKKRTKIVLGKMKELNYISEEEYNLAIQEVEKGLKFKKGIVSSEKDIYSYHIDSVISEVIDDVAKKYKISDVFALNYLEMAGLEIVSTQDEKIQKQIEVEFSKSKYVVKSKNTEDRAQAAMVVMDYSTGNVLGIVGGMGEKKESRSYNRAIKSVRQTGSAIKPIAVLAPALDKKIITMASVYDDVEKIFGENNYRPIDYTKPLGKITVRRAVESSQNIPFVDIMQQLGTNNSIKYLRKMGVTSLTKKDDELPLALGGLDRGISPLEMAGAYSTIANDGVYIEPTFYKIITKRNGEEFVNKKQKTRRVFSKEVAYILKEVLTQPVQGNYGTATYCKISGVDVAAKTGTTDENYDRWLCGFTPYYTAVTWFGFDKNESIEFNKRNPAGLIWANVMSRIHAGKTGKSFEKPENVLEYKVCSKTGERARSSCTNTYIEYFLKGTIPGFCSEHSGSEENGKKDNNVKGNSGVIKDIINEIDEDDPQIIQQEKEE